MFINMCKYTQKLNNKTCELGHGWHAQVGCMGKDISPPLKNGGVVAHLLGAPVGTYPMAPGSNNTHVLLTQPHPCGAMREQCCTRLCLARGLHHRRHNGLGKMLTAGAVCPCGQHLRRPCGPQLTASCDTVLLNQKSHPSLELQSTPNWL